jgi:hypothetical protein
VVECGQEKEKRTSGNQHFWLIRRPLTFCKSPCCICNSGGAGEGEIFLLGTNLDLGPYQQAPPSPATSSGWILDWIGQNWLSIAQGPSRSSLDIATRQRDETRRLANAHLQQQPAFFTLRSLLYLAPMAAGHSFLNTPIPTQVCRVGAAVSRDLACASAAFGLSSTLGI